MRLKVLTGRPASSGKPAFVIRTELFYAMQAAKPLIEAIGEFFPDSRVFALWPGKENDETRPAYLGGVEHKIEFVMREKDVSGSPKLFLDVPLYHDPQSAENGFAIAYDDIFGGLRVTLNAEAVKFDVKCPVSEKEKRSIRRELGVKNQFVLVAAQLPNDDVRKWAILHKRLTEEAPETDIVTAITPRYVKGWDLRGCLRGVDCRFMSDTHRRTIQGSGIVVVDQFGKLPKIYSVGHAAYVHGDHNILEPAEQAIPVIYSKSNSNFPLSVSGLERSGRGYPVESEGEALDRILALIRDPQMRESMGAQAKRFKDENAGVSRWLMSHLRDEVLPNYA